MRNRHLPARGINRQTLKLVQCAPVLRQSHPNIHFIVHRGRTIRGDLKPGGEQLNGTADGGDIGSHTGSGFAIHMHLPLDARQAAVILNIGKAAKVAHHRRDLINPCIGNVRVGSTHLQHNRLAAAGAHLLLLKLQGNAWDILGALSHIRQNGASRTALIPVDKLELQHANYITTHLLVGHSVRAGVERLHFPHTTQALLHALQYRVSFFRRKIATGAYQYLGAVRLDTGKKVYAMVKACIAGVQQCDEQYGKQQYPGWVLQETAQYPTVTAA